MSIFATAGRTKIYGADGTGRDSYVGNNSGGFTVANQPAASFKGGSFGRPQVEVSPQHIARGGGQGSPGKRIHYQTNGTGRDSYIHFNHGGFANNFQPKNDRDVYVESLRGYSLPVQDQQRAIYANQKKIGQARQDHFIQGQISIRSAKARNSLNMLRTYQKSQVDRMSLPKRPSIENLALIAESFDKSRLSPKNLDESDSPRSKFLRKTTQSFQMTHSPSQDGHNNQALANTFGSKGQISGTKKNVTSSLNNNQLRDMLTNIASLPTTSINEEYDLDAEIRAKKNSRNLVKSLGQKYTSHFEKSKRKANADFSTIPVNFNVLRIVQGQTLVTWGDRQFLDTNRLNTNKKGSS